MRAWRPLTIDELLACRRLDQFAPRLAAARDSLRRQRARRSQLREATLKRERLVAHRELQFARACATGNGRYITARQRKLDAARKELAAYQRRLAAAERAA